MSKYDEVCNMCGRTATVVDTDDDELYCDIHAEEYDVFGGPYVLIPKDLREKVAETPE